MLARRLIPILPAMPLADALDTTHLPGVAGLTGVVCPRMFYTDLNRLRVFGTFGDDGASICW
jgi:hypothetical protein